jgi:hypothetical protein
MPKLNETIPLIGTLFGGITIGVISRNTFTNWTGETLLAGLLGLAGGWLAYKAATDQRHAAESRNEYIFRADHFADLMEAQEKADRILRNDFASETILDPGLGHNLEILIRKVEGAASFPHPLPLELSKELESICGAMPLLITIRKSISGHYEEGRAVGVNVKHPQALELALKVLRQSLEDMKTSAILREFQNIH